jgi:hypothetical protein
LAVGQDLKLWIVRLLLRIGVRPGTHFDVFAEGWRAGQRWQRIEVFGVSGWIMPNPDE